MGESPRLAAPAIAYRDSYRAFVAELAARGEEPIPFTLSMPHENFEAFLAQLAGCERGIGIPSWISTSASPSKMISSIC